MKKHLIILSAFIISLAAFPGSVNAAVKKTETPIKEWTFLVFLNGHNNLDSFGDMNIKQMEEVGSNDKINIVVQWASMSASKTKRMLIQKSTNPNEVTSPSVEELPPVDMGDYNELTKFIEWGAKNYPAKHYFVDVWNHGNGWHLVGTRAPIKINDISYDDRTGNHITTEHLGQSLREAAQTIGQKIDIYGSDACLMAMAEVAGEMSDAVDYFVGSEEVEPGQGWPYSTFLRQWNAMADASPREVAKLLSRDYLAAYSGGIYGNESVTMSAMDLTQMDAFNAATANLAVELGNSSADQMMQISQSANSTQQFTLSDYKDLTDFLNQMAKHPALASHREAAAEVHSAMEKLVISNDSSAEFSGAHGVAIWLPTSSYEYDDYSKRYEGMRFNQATGWGKFLSKMQHE